MRQTRWSTAASAIARCDAMKLLPSPGAALLTTSTLPGSSVSPQASITLARSRRKASPGSGDIPAVELASSAGAGGTSASTGKPSRRSMSSGECTLRRRYSRPNAPPTAPMIPSSPAAARPWLRRGRIGAAGVGGLDDADGAAVGGARQDRFLGLLEQGVEDLSGADRFALERGVGHALLVEG